MAKIVFARVPLEKLIKIYVKKYHINNHVITRRAFCDNNKMVTVRLINVVKTNDIIIINIYTHEKLYKVHRKCDFLVK